MNNIFKLIISVSIPLATGAIAGIVTAKEIPGWYALLNKPSFSPPNWLFGPVWTSLYILMGISLFLIWKIEPGKLRDQALIIFAIQLILNFAWSFLFFYFKNMGLALAEIFILWVFIALMIFSFSKVNIVAAWLNVPYLLWVSFATILNFAYFRLN